MRITAPTSTPDIARIERQLDRLGYDVGARDGVQDAALTAAIKAFKADQNDIDNDVGFLGKRGQTILAAEVKALDHDPYRGRRALTLEQHRQDGVLAELSKRQNADGTEGIGEGAQRPGIQMLQLRLRAAGFDPQHVDGVFDERTRGALEQFQQASGLEVTGRLDAKTWAKLSRTIIDTDQPATPVQTVGERSRAVLRTEKLLEKAGFKPGDADGLFTKRTEAAVRRLEAELKGPDDGKLGVRELEALKQIANNPFVEPKHDYRRVVYRDGEVLNRRTIQMFEQAENWAAKHGVPKGWGFYQGSYSTSVDASANTHAGGGAMDLKTFDKTPKQIHTMVEALRRAGFAAYYRPTMDPPHIHAIAIGDRELSSDARGQVREYLAGGDGLIGSAPDPHRDIGRPLPEWAR
ncbi:MAG: peptidoglycan-binding protein [Myxococcaceae bacterium]|nr:peptidoglycan-binding protein [Myxococcaceae bacterium]